MTGHWEIAGAVLPEPFAVFPSFPEPLVEKLSRAAGVGFLGNCAANGLFPRCPCSIPRGCWRA